MTDLFAKERIAEHQYAPCYSKKGLNISRKIIKPLNDTNGIGSDLNGRRLPL